MRSRLGRLAAAVVAAAFVSACGHLPGMKQQARQVSEALARVMSQKRPPAFVGPDRDSRRTWALTKAFYQKRDHAPAWIEGKSPRPQMDDFIAALQDAGREGLDPALYSTSTLAARRAEAVRGFLTRKGFSPDEAVALDAWLTYLYLHYASDLANGLSDLSHADPNWQIRGEQFDALATLEQALEQNRIRESLEDLIPHDPEYLALRDALARYREIAGHGGWPALPPQLVIRPGQRSRAVPALVRRLAAEKDYEGPLDAANTRYTPALVDAVKRFQRRHGMDATGIVDPAVVEEMNVPADARVRQLELNMERRRWLPRDLGAQHIVVNVPEYRLEVWDQGRVSLAMRVVVGKQDTPTPIFSDEMTYVVFAPYWNVPSSIVEKETLPSLLTDPSFLQKTNMEVVDDEGNVVDPATIDPAALSGYHFRQRPGTSNSLGLVKFMFPNQYNVYLHDTPADSLFARATRSLSHGCVRVQEPEPLAEYVLRDQPQWTPQRIEEAMHGSDETIAKLRRPLPVYLVYFTVRVTPEGGVQFLDDIYGIDRQQSAALAKVVNAMKKQAAAGASATPAS